MSLTKTERLKLLMDPRGRALRDEGRKAHDSGRRQNPYPQDTLEHVNWAAGFREADGEHS